MNSMFGVATSIVSIRPSIRAAHYHRYSGTRWEKNRLGYCYAFHLIDKGEGSVEMSGHRYPLKKGSLLFVPPGLMHSFRHSVKQPISSYDLYCDLYVPIPTGVHLCYEPMKDYHPELSTKIPEDFNMRSLLGAASLSRYPELIQTFIQIIRLNRTEIEYKTEIVNSLLYSWVLQWFNLKTVDNIPDYRIQRIIDLMEKHPGINPPYEQWLELCQLRKSQFYNLFKKMTGLTPKECFLRIKMQRAQALLNESNRSITSIAEELGYSTLHYFSKQFSEYFGVSPSEQRRNTIKKGNHI